MAAFSQRKKIKKPYFQGILIAILDFIRNNHLRVTELICYNSRFYTMLSLPCFFFFFLQQLMVNFWIKILGYMYTCFFFIFFFNLAACSLFYIPPTLALRKKEKSVFAEAHKPCFYASSICPEGWPVNCSDFICSWASGLSRCYLNPCSFSYIRGL